MADSTEIGAIADATNRLTIELDQGFRSASRQDRELDAIVSNMAEGIVVTDSDGRVLRVNDAALTILGLRHDAIFGRAAARRRTTSNW